MISGSPRQHETGGGNSRFGDCTGICTGRLHLKGSGQGFDGKRGDKGSRSSRCPEDAQIRRDWVPGYVPLKSLQSLCQSLWGTMQFSPLVPRTGLASVEEPGPQPGLKEQLPRKRKCWRQPCRCQTATVCHKGWWLRGAPRALAATSHLACACFVSFILSVYNTSWGSEIQTSYNFSSLFSLCPRKAGGTQPLQVRVPHRRAGWA